MHLHFCTNHLTLLRAVSPQWVFNRPFHPNGNYNGTQANHQQCLWIQWPVSLPQWDVWCLNPFHTLGSSSFTLPVCSISWFSRWLKRRRTKRLQRKCAHCYLKDDSETKDGAELCDICKLRDWLSNYRLNDVDSFSLFNEFLEMGLSSPNCSNDGNSKLHLLRSLTFLLCFLLSDPVQLHDHICGSVSTCSSVSSH